MPNKDCQMEIIIKNKYLKNKKGTALAYALVIMFVVSIILVSMISYITAQLKFSFNRVEKQQSFQIAEAGIYYYKWYLAHQTVNKTPAEIATFWQTGGELGFTPAAADYEGIGQYELVITQPSAGSTAVTVTSTGWTYKNTNLKRIIRVRFRLPSWSEYALMTNGPMHLGEDTIIYGKLHSNGGIWFDGVAYNTISALPAFYDDGQGSNLDFGVHTSEDDNAPGTYPWPPGTVLPNNPEQYPDIFKGGREFPVPEVNFSGVTLDLAAMKQKAITSGKYFDDSGEGRWIVLKGDKFDICTVDTHHHISYTVSKFKQNDGTGTCNSCSDADCVTANLDIPQDGVIFVENDVWVKGNVDSKRVTIVADNPNVGGDAANIYIGPDSTGNIRYASYECSNKIGLVAQKDILITKDAPDDFIVDAAVIAQTGMVGISQNFTSGSRTITFNGAVASFLEPFFMHGGNGYAVRLFNYDNSLLYCPPPDFPTGSQYAIDLWEEL